MSRPLRHLAARLRSGLLAGALAALPCVAAAAQPSVAAGAARVRIELRPEVEVNHRALTLGDVAVITTRELPLLERLAALPLGALVRAGVPVRVDRDHLGRWVAVRGGVRPDEMEWAGAAVAKVSLASQQVPGPAVAEVARGALVAAAQRAGLRAEIQEAQAPRDLVAPAGPLELNPRAIGEAELRSRRPTVWVEVWSAGTFVRLAPVRFDLTVYGPAYVIARRAAPGERLEPGELEVKETRWTGLDVLPVDRDVVRPVRVKAPVAPGAPLTRAQVEPAPDVARGSLATLRSVQGRVALEGQVEVLEDGHVGQSVRVKLPSSKAALLARVTGPGAVEVEP
ncbi:MAG: flagellar basal body P-ring formation chaperone FlgA [Anaeromyxobacter sp.]